MPAKRGSAAAFKEVEAEAFEFYLGKVIKRSFRLPREQMAKAHERVRERVQRLAEAARKSKNAFERIKLDDWEKLAAAKSLPRYFEVLGCPLVFDAKGDVTDVKQGGDLWAFEELAVIAPLIEAGSHLVIRDDEERLWRLSFDGERMVYEKQR